MGQRANTPSSPQQLRLHYRRQRRALSSLEQQQHASLVARAFRTSALYRHCRSIACYLANDGELDPQQLITRAWQNGKKVHLPALRGRPQRSLWFCEFRPGDRLLVNRFGIAEPDFHKRPPVPPWGIDLIFLPLVAFDIHGNRLGMGGGFYDRSLAHRRYRQYWCRPKLIGLAHECQLATQLERRAWDIPLDGVLTEAGYRRFR